MNNPILNKFFELGDKATGKDPYRKAQYDYYLLWIMFLAFLSIGVGNFINFLEAYQISYLGWTIVMLIILWFQYYGLKQARMGLQLLQEMRKAQKGRIITKNVSKIESEKEMLKGFKK